MNRAVATLPRVRCSICKHDERAAIEAALAAGDAPSLIARRFPASALAIERHRKHVVAPRPGRRATAKVLTLNARGAGKGRVPAVPERRGGQGTAPESEAATPAIPASPPELDEDDVDEEVSLEIRPGMARELAISQLRTIRRLRRRNPDPTEQVRLAGQELRAINLIAALNGELLAGDEARLTQTARFKEIVAAIANALSPERFKEAAQAVAAALKELEAA